MVLRNRYYNFTRAEKARRRLENETGCVSLDAAPDGAQSLYGVLGDGREYGSASVEEFDRMVDRIVANLKDRQRVFFHLY